MKNVFLWVIEFGGILFIVKSYLYNEALRAYAKFCKRIETRRKVTAFFSNVQIKQKKYQSLLQNQLSACQYLEHYPFFYLKRQVDKLDSFSGDCRMFVRISSRE